MKKSAPEYSFKGLMPDYINFIGVLILGFIFNQQSTDITGLFAIQIVLLLFSLALFSAYKFLRDLFSKSEITPSNSLDKDKTFASPLAEFFVLGWCGLFLLGILIATKILNNMAIGLVYFPFVLYANRKIFLKYKNDSMLGDYATFLKGLFVICCFPILLFMPQLLKNIGCAHGVSFFICYSVLCFPYKNTLRWLFPKCVEFFSSPDKFFMLVWTAFALIFFLLACYGYWMSDNNEPIEILLGTAALLIFGIIGTIFF